MRGMRGTLVVLCVVVLALGGCAAKSTGSPKDIAKPPATIGVDDEGKGKLIGYVVDEEEAPIEGASVGILLQGTPPADALKIPGARTDSAGSFAFLGLEPGQYFLLAQKLGYVPIQQVDVAVVAGETTDKTIILIAEPSNEPYPQTRDKEGIVSGWGYKFNGQSDNSPLTLGSDFDTAHDDWKTWEPPGSIRGMVGELQWSNSQALAGNMLFLVYVKGALEVADKEFIHHEGPSPMRVQVGMDRISAVFAKGDAQCTNPSAKDYCWLASTVRPGGGNTNGDVDIAFTLQQRFSERVTVFFNMDVPAGYSAFA